VLTYDRPPLDEHGLEASDRYLNRELSWLHFNERVLALTEDTRTPLLEKAKFLAIFSSNLDEFFMVRVAALKRQQAAEVAPRSADGKTAGEQIDMISAAAHQLTERQARFAVEGVMPALGEQGIGILHWSDLRQGQRKELETIFRERIFPILTPLAVDPGHPFPYISNLSLNLAVLVRDPDLNRVLFARVKVPPLLPRLLPLSDRTSFVPLEDVIAANLGELFSGMEIIEHHAFRVTRDTELEVDDDRADDLLVALEEELMKRRFARAVRLEIVDGMPDHLLELLMRELQVDEADVYRSPGLLDLTALTILHACDRPDLKDPPFVPVTHPKLASSDETAADVFAVLRDQDVLVHHPYESFATSVQRFIEQAATDPEVLAIKQTLYRTSGESPIVDALIEAAELGKQVVVLVEIKARFDEIPNINWARTLEKAGCHVVYGLVGLKTHAKLCMVVRREGDKLRRYVHIGTGNYNPSTARIYEDLGLLTADESLGADIGDLFNYLTGYSRQTDYRSLIVAPHSMRERIVSMIEREAELAKEGKHARIVMKLNNLVDEAVVDALYRASQAGVQVDLLVRAICALRPQVPDLSPSITVRSILGRFLEHSRIYYFANGGNEEFYMGSADMMHRNLDRRVETLVKVERPETKERVRSVLEKGFADNCYAWTLGPGGGWTPVAPALDGPGVSLQAELMRNAGHGA
jgi:polyphosphate kinase